VGVQVCDLYFSRVFDAGIVLRKIYHGLPVKREQTKSRERLLRTIFLIQVTCNIERERPDMDATALVTSILITTSVAPTDLDPLMTRQALS